MKEIIVIVILVCLAGAAVSAQTRATLQSLAFVAGCWEMKRPEKNTLVTEQWMAPSGGAMMGMSRTVRDGKMTGFEFLRIVESEDGLHYISKPSQNMTETAFKLIKSSKAEAVFENPTHDFPQRRIYKLTKPGHLTARIEGTMVGKFRGIDFPMTREPCP